VKNAVRATYRLAVAPGEVGARVEALCHEQTVELPPAAVTDPFVREAILPEVEEVVAEGSPGGFRVRVAYPELTTALDPAQLLNVLFGNSSMHPDVDLVGVSLPPGLEARLGGPGLGAGGLRSLTGVAPGRALTCTALKPMGLSSKELAGLCARFARGGIDVVKDDHGLADHATAPFEERLTLCQAAIEEESSRSGRRSLYAPNLVGTPEVVRARLELARERGVRAVLVAPMLLGLPFLAELARVSDGIAILAHPAFAGAQRIAFDALFGTLFRAYGADASIFPHAGGRFGLALDTCRRLAEELRAPRGGILPALPVPAGGMSVERVRELIGFYGTDCMLLVGGSLYLAGGALDRRIGEFVEGVARASEDHGRGAS
jgi:ribulose-bisphosphate carboxylase large chain